MCYGRDCPLKEKCYRHTAPKSEYWQSYMTWIPYKNGKCDKFWDNSNRKSNKPDESNPKI